MDRLRLLIIYFLASDDNDLSKFEQYLKAEGCDTAALEYLKNQRSYIKMSESRYSFLDNNILTKLTTYKVRHR